MTTAHHTPLAFGAPRNAAVLNAPLGQLDAAIAAVIATGSGASTTLTAQALAGQPSLTVANSAAFAVDQIVFIGPSGGTNESKTISAIPNGTTITLSANLANTHASGAPVTASPIELVDARGGLATLGARLNTMEAAENVKRHGAKGDGTTDDTTAVQAAITAANGGVVYLPPGTYKITSALTVAVAGTMIRGSGDLSHLNGATLGAGVHCLFTSAAGVTFRDFKITAPAAAGSGDAIRLSGSDEAVENVTVVGGANGITAGNGLRARIAHCRVTGVTDAVNGFGILCSGTGEGHRIVANDVRGCRVGIAVNDKNGLCVVQGNVIDGCTDIGISLDGDVGFGGLNVVVGNTVDASGSAAYGCIFVGETLDAAIIGNVLRGAPAGHGIRFVASGDRASIVGNVIVGNALSGILLSSSADILISGNTIADNGNYGLDIFTVTRALITGNRVDGNGTAAGSFAGIRLFAGSGVYVEGNHLVDNDGWGIDVASGTGHRIGANQFNGNALGEVTKVVTDISTRQDDRRLTSRFAWGPPLGASSAIAVTANQGIYVPITVGQRCQVTAARLEIGTQAGNMQVALYDADFNQLSTTGTIAVPAAGVATVTLPTVDIQPGLYYLGIMFSSASATLHMMSNNVGSFLDPVFRNEAGFGLPNPVGAVASFGSVMPKIVITGS